MHEIAPARLRGCLESLAMYNDKGFAWSGHDEAQSEQVREAHRADLERLIAQIGAERVPMLILQGLASGEVLYDASGRFAEAVREWAGYPPSIPM